MNNQDIKPSRWYYGLATVVFLTGVLLFTLFLFNSLSALTGGLTQLVVPTIESDITFSEAGKYTIFYEYQTVIDNKLYFTGESLSGMQCTLTRKATGHRIALSRPLARSTYSLGGRKGVSVLEFNIDQPGIYEFSASYPEGQEGPEVVLAVGHGFLKNLIGTIVGGLAIFFGSIVIAIAIAVVTVLKRQKARKQLESNYGYDRIYGIG
jgi:hypothetical protein